MRARSGLRWKLRSITAAIVLAWSAPGSAQESASLRQEYDAQFQRMLRNPTDLEATFRFAEVATKLRDYEAAIGALTKILYYNPNLARIHLELAVLYIRLGSYDLARAHLQSALATPDLPPDVRARANQFLAEIDTLDAPRRWAVFAQTGLRYQTNATAGPSGPVDLGLNRGRDFARGLGRRPDWNAFGLGTVGFTHQFENPAVSFEAGLVGYYARQFQVERLNLGLVELNAGPRFDLSSRIPGTSLRVYGLANGVSLGDGPYLGTAGGGASVRFTLGGKSFLEPFVEYRRREFFDTKTYPAATQQTGDLVTFGGVTAGNLSDKVAWVARFGYDLNDARFAFNSYDRVFLDVGLPLGFDVRWAGASHNWIVTPVVGLSRAEYRAPDPAVRRFVSRDDTEYRFGALLDAQIHNKLGFNVQVLHTEVDSNLSIYSYKNLSVMFGPTLRF